MKAQPPALTQAALVATAGRRARKVQHKLHEAEAQLHDANQTLVKAVPTRDEESIDAALQQNVAAEEKVHEATEELEIVNALLADATDSVPAIAPQPPSPGQTGQGVKSLVPLLAQRQAASR